MNFDSANNVGGVQGHSQGEYFPVTIKTIGDHSGSEPVYTHTVLYNGAESWRYDSFEKAEEFARHIKFLIGEVGIDEATDVVKASKKITWWV